MRMRWAVLVVVGSLILGCAGFNEAMERQRKEDEARAAQWERDRPANEARAAQQKKEREELRAQKEEAARGKFHTWTQQAGFSYIMDEWYALYSVGSGYSRKTAPDDAVYIVVDYRIRNDGNETAVIYNRDFELREDSTGRTYRSSSEAETALMFSGADKGFLLEELQPGLSKKQFAAFLIPKSSYTTALRLVVPTKGWSGGSLEFTLKKEDRK